MEYTEHWWCILYLHKCTHVYFCPPSLPPPVRQWSASPTTCDSAVSSGFVAAAAASGAAAADAAAPCGASQNEPPSPPAPWGCIEPPASRCPWPLSAAPPPSRDVLLRHSAGATEVKKSGNSYETFSVEKPLKGRNNILTTSQVFQTSFKPKNVQFLIFRFIALS